MQTIIKFNEDKQLQKMSSNTIYEGENLADSLLFLFPQSYGGYSFDELEVTLHWANENNEGDVVLAEFEEELFRESYFCYTFSITGAITSVPGKVILWAEITEANSGLLCKTDTISIYVKPHSDSAEYTPEETPQLFQEYKIQMQQLINTATIIQQNITEAETRIDEKIALMLNVMEEWEEKYGSQKL